MKPAPEATQRRQFIIIDVHVYLPVVVNQSVSYLDHFLLLASIGSILTVIFYLVYYLVL